MDSAQSFGEVEYSEWFCAEGKDPPNEFPGYDAKQSVGWVPVLLELCGLW